MNRMKSKREKGVNIYVRYEVPTVVAVKNTIS
jgi:hypothetical protein